MTINMGLYISGIYSICVYIYFTLRFFTNSEFLNILTKVLKKICKCLLI